MLVFARSLAVAAYLLLSISAQVAFAETPAAAPPDADRLAAARELLDVTGASKQLETMMDVMTSSFAKGANADSSEVGKALSEDFKANMDKLMTYKQDMLNDFAHLYAERFTADEMRELTKFYRSGIGAKFLTQMPELMQAGSAIGIKYSQKVVEELQAIKNKPQP